MNDLGHAFQHNRMMRWKFFCSPLNYRDRCFFAAFAYINGIHIEVILEVLRFTNRHNLTDQRADKIRRVFEWFRIDAGARERYYGFNCVENRITNLNGQILERDAVRQRDTWMTYDQC